MLIVHKDQRGDIVAVLIIGVAFIAILGLCFWAILASKSQSRKIINGKTPQHIQTKPNGEPVNN